MKKNNIGYLLREGFRGVFLHGFMSFAAICVTVACLIIMGSFCLILYNTSAMVKELESENEMLVYIDENYSEAKAKSVGSQINLITNARSATCVIRLICAPTDQPYHECPLRDLRLTRSGA